MNSAPAKKSGLIVAMVLAAVAVGVFWRSSPPSAPPPATAVPVAGPDGSVLATTQDSAAVYQKAFWRNPDPDDKILHAERREWTASGDGVRKWQWFIALQPGPRTREWIDTNPFSLTPAPPEFSLSKLEHRPAWFPAEAADHEIRQNPEGRLIWLQRPDRTILYATDSGFGFAAPTSKP